MNNTALLIGLGSYRDKKISNIGFVTEDISEFGKSLEKLDYPAKNIKILLNSDATKTNIESELRSITKRLTKEDKFLLYFSGHGFSKNDKNYITSFDTRNGDLENTSIPLQDIFAQLRNCKSEKKLFFIDSCHSGMPIDTSMKDITTTMSDEELREFFNNAKYTIGFSSCSVDEKSFVVPLLKHSIWTYHLIKAFRGEDSEAISKNNLVTANSLQNYLSREVPASVIKYKTSGMQTPEMFGNMNRDFIVADLNPIFEEEKRKRLSKNIEIDRILFSVDSTDSIQSLSGFVKVRHSVPKDKNSFTEGWIKEIAESDIKDKIEEIFDLIKVEFTYKRKDFEVEYDAGQGRIITPDFEFWISIEQSNEDFAYYEERMELFNISSSDLVRSAAFNKVFSGIFDTIEFDFKNKFNLEEIIDLIEENKPNDIDVDYPTDFHYCELTFQDTDILIRIENNTLKITEKKVSTPEQLVKQLEIIRKRLLSMESINNLLN